MRIALTSQNRKTITGHAGMCRNFLVYDIENGQIAARNLVELAPDQTFHANSGGQAQPLAGISILISGGMGAGLRQNLLRNGIQPIVTGETDPESVVAALLAGHLDTSAGHTCECGSGGHHDHAHTDHNGGCNCH